MPRPLRILYPGACYHVTHGLEPLGASSGPSSALLFANREDTAYFLTLLQAAVQRFDVVIHAYCLLPTRYHLLLETRQANLHEVMRHLNQLYAQQLRRRGDGAAARFEGRYYAWLLDASRYLASVAKVIHREPIALTGEAMYTQYRWSSVRAYLGKEPAPVWLTVKRVQQHLSEQAGGLAYDAYLASPLPQAVQRFYALRRRRPVLGHKAFHEAAKQRGVVEDGCSAVAPWRKPKGSVLAMDWLVREVAMAFQVDVDQVLESQRGRQNTARNVAIYLARSTAQMGATQVAEHFGLASHSAVSNVMAAMMKRLAHDVALAAQVQALQLRLARGRVRQRGFRSLAA